MKINLRAAFSKLALLDVLVFPFLKPLPITITMLPIAVWNIVNIKRLSKGGVNLAGILFIAACLTSVAISMVFGENHPDSASGAFSIIGKNIAYLAILILFFLYLNFLSAAIKRQALDPYSYIKFYLYFNFSLAAIFWIDYSLYFSMREIWTLSDELEIGDFSSITRFTGVMSDPNNAAIAIVASLVFLCMYRSINTYQFIIYIFMTVFCVTACMSSTGFIALGVAICILSLKLIKGRAAGRLSVVRMLWVFAGLAVSVILIYILIYNSEIGEMARERLGENTADSRIEKIYYLFRADSIIKLLVGDGGTVFFDGKAFAPHVGHLHFLLNYGIVAYILFMYAVFRVRKDVSFYLYAPLGIVLIGFTSNTGFIDFRFSIFVATILAAYRVLHSDNNTI